MRKNIFTWLLMCSILILSSCDNFDDVALWNKSNNMERRIEKIEDLCDQMNSNIAGLQTIVTAVQDNDYVKSIVPIVSEGKEIGYSIYFSKSGIVTIYHGTDGKDGSDGKDGADGTDGKDGANGVNGADGVSPVISVAVDDDGVYYWTLNGDWLTAPDGTKIAAQGTSGKDGADGADGSNGKDGKDGITPQLRIDNGYWMLSSDNGNTWSQLGKATGNDGKDGVDGKDGRDGDPLFKSVDYTTSAEYVAITLCDGSEIVIPTWSAFEALRTYCSQINTNIEALKTIVTALQTKDYVTDVTPLVENGVEIGYIIRFTNSNPVTIYHGRNGADGSDGKDGADGADGKDGADGSAPAISVRTDADGIYYWVIDGEWLLDSDGKKVKAQGTDGKDGSDGKDGNDGADGTNGSDGSNGKDGKDGITPQMKIENGKWLISLDNGASWTVAGNATGSDGADGKDGDSMFQSVDCKTSPDYVIFTLSDGTVMKLPTWEAFEALMELCNKMNTNISALQTIVNALQDNNYVTSVTPIMELGKEIGYTIAFTKSNPITIYHGQDGKNGADAVAPVISVKADADGIYYWTLDNDWLTDEHGVKIKAQGVDGSGGAAGKDGVTPQLRIEEGDWMLSTDKGATWTNLGKASGSDGADGKDGDSFFKSVTQNGSEVCFELSDGTVIKIKKYNTNQLSVTFSRQYNIPIWIDKDVAIDFTINGNDGQPVTFTYAASGFKLSVTQKTANSGTIRIKAEPYYTANMNILLYATCGETSNMSMLSMEYDYSQNDNALLYRHYLDYRLKEKTGVETDDDYKTFYPEKFGSEISSHILNDYYGCIIFSSPLTSIEFGAFGGYISSSGSYSAGSACRFTELVFPNTLTRLPDYLYTPAYLTRLVLPDNLEYLGTGLIGTKVTEIKLPEKLKVIADKAFYESIITSINLPASLDSIGAGAFRDSKITSIELPESLKYIGGYAFGGCKLTGEQLVIPDNVEYIGASAFNGANCFNDIIIGKSLTHLENYAFSTISKRYDGDTEKGVQVYLKPAKPNFLKRTQGSMYNVFFYNVFSMKNTIFHVSSESLDSYTAAWGTYTSNFVGDYEF